MMKDFDEWNLNKKKINNSKKHILYHKRDIWWCYVGCNICSEQDGNDKNFERPVLILNKINSNLFLGMPLTTRYKGEDFKFNIGDIKGKESYILVDQLRIMSSKRLKRKMVFIKEKTFLEIKIILVKNILDKKKNPRS